MKNFEKLSSDLTETLDKVLPSNVRCVVIIYDIDDHSVAAISDMPDEEVVLLLEDALAVMENPSETKVIENKTIN